VVELAVSVGAEHVAVGGVLSMGLFDKCRFAVMAAAIDRRIHGM